MNINKTERFGEMLNPLQPYVRYFKIYHPSMDRLDAHIPRTGTFKNNVNNPGVYHLIKTGICCVLLTRSSVH